MNRGSMAKQVMEAPMAGCGSKGMRKGGMVKKKSAKMAGGGAVRGAGCATKGKGKMRMY